MKGFSIDRASCSCVFLNVSCQFADKVIVNCIPRFGCQRHVDSMDASDLFVKSCDFWHPRGRILFLRQCPCPRVISSHVPKCVKSEFRRPSIFRPRPDRGSCFSAISRPKTDFWSWVCVRNLDTHAKSIRLRIPLSDASGRKNRVFPRCPFDASSSHRFPPAPLPYGALTPSCGFPCYGWRPWFSTGFPQRRKNCWTEGRSLGIFPLAGVFHGHPYFESKSTI